ncbi:Uncharacterised protein [Bordetella pertussis]|nr:Uncharacterised protein [Bordetella pertussis]
MRWPHGTRRPGEMQTGSLPAARRAPLKAPV